MRGYRNTTFLDGCPLLLLTEMNFLVHLQEVGVTSQNSTLKQHQTHWFCLQGCLTTSSWRRNNDKTVKTFFQSNVLIFPNFFFFQDLHALKSNPFAMYKLCCVLQGRKRTEKSQESFSFLCTPQLLFLLSLSSNHYYWKGSSLGAFIQAGMIGAFLWRMHSGSGCMFSAQNDSQRLSLNLNKNSFCI